jgi:hypothetical protein
MTQIKDTSSDPFSNNKKKDEGVSSEIETEPGIKEETEHETEFENEPSAQEETDADSEWEKRVLCTDGNCIGVIGPDGRCKECGKPYEGTEHIYPPDDNSGDISDMPPSDEELISDEQDFFSDNLEEPPEPADKSVTETDSSSDSDSEWDKRILCSDGNCIGVIGPDRRCKECGKPYEG